MEEKPGSGGSLHIPALLLAVAVAGGLFVRPAALFSPRPQGDGPLRNDSPATQKVPARLWQDPLMAVERALESGAGLDALKPEEFGAFREVIADRAKAKPPEVTRSPGVRILAVMLPSSGYTEDVEMRRRARTAVIAGLGSAGYRALHDEHLGVVRIPWAKKTPPEPWEYNKQPLAEIWPLTSAEPMWAALVEARNVAFEWFPLRLFHPSDPAMRDQVLILWLPDSMFADSPLPRLAQLVHALRDGYDDLPCEAVQVSILGPYGSSALRLMLPWQNDPTLRETLWEERLAARDATEWLKDVPMFSWSATAMDDLLVHGIATDTPRQEVARYLKTAWGLDFRNVTATDEQLAAETLHELKLRKVDLTNPREHVALIAEFDTFYGRNVPVAFAAQVALWQKKFAPSVLGHPMRDVVEDFRKEHDVEAPWHAFRQLSNVHIFGYLRGIDGKVPAEKPGVKEPERPRPDSRAKDSAKETEREMDRAEGQNQLDYVPRLGDQLEAMQAALSRAEERGELKAIGVVGSDFYDKLLILQALRPRFPRALFFSTDLDARYLQPEFEQWTRNLLVVSPFGLRLAPHLQREAPPFRGSYQTALYFATLQALEGDGVAAGIGTPPPRRFEIGRYSAVDLSIGNSPVHPERVLAWPRPRVFWLLAGVLLCGWWLLQRALTWVRYGVSPLARSLLLYEKLRVQEDDLRDTRAICTGILSDPDNVLPRTLAKARSDTKRGEVSVLFFDAGKVLLDGKSAQPASEFVSETSTSERLSLRKTLNEEMDALADEYEKKIREQSGAKGGAPTAKRSGLLAAVGSRWIGLWRYGWRARLLGGAQARLELEARFPRALGPCQPRCEHAANGLRWIFIGLLVFFGVIATFSVCALRWSHLPEGEPFSLIEGISVWPAECLRLLAAMLGFIFIVRAGSVVRANAVELTQAFQLEPWSSENFWAAVRHQSIADSTLLRWRTKQAGIFETFTWPWLRRRLRWVVQFIAWRRVHRLLGWYPQQSSPRIDGQELWNEYRERGRHAARLLRLITNVVIYLLFTGTLWFLLEPRDFPPSPSSPLGFTLAPFAPARDLGGFNAFLTMISVLVMVFLVFWVVDATRLCRVFVIRLSAKPTDYPRETLRHFARETGGMAHEDLDEWIDMRIIAERTAVVGELIYYPFIVLALMIVARSHYFDAWDWPVPLIIIFILNAAWAISAALTMQRTAEEARRSSLRRLEEKQLTAQHTGDKIRQEKLQHLANEIKNLSEGAFASFFKNPILRAVLLPFSGAGALQIVDFLMR